MRKLYIFFTDDIRLMGGIQRYALTKALYMAEKGYEIFMFFDGFSYGKCKLEELEHYTKDEIPGLRILPYEYPSFLLNSMLRRIKKKLGNVDGAEIIIESHSHPAAMWGELLAAQIKAKHMCFLCNEVFYGEGKYYSDRLDFYSFKYDRKELYGISDSSIENLFGEYRKIDNSAECRFCAAMGSAVRDVVYAGLDIIKNSDWTIGYVGRANKFYVPEIVKGVVDFSNMYPDKSIQFVIVGETGQYEKLFKPLMDCGNISVVKLGDLSPIPLKLFSKLDVVIAGSGCAYYSAKAGALTIVADARNFKANGLLGYDTTNYIFAEDGEKQTDFASAIKSVLIDKSYIGKEFHLSSSELDDTQKHFDKQLFDSQNNDYGMQYYDSQKLLNNDFAKQRISMRKFMSAYFPAIVLFIRKVKDTK